jgi:hypothetical protein
MRGGESRTERYERGAERVGGVWRERERVVLGRSRNVASEKKLGKKN